MDIHKCGDCQKEFDSYESFLIHKLLIEHYKLTLEDSVRIPTLRLPKFIKVNHASNHNCGKEETPVKKPPVSTPAENSELEKSRDETEGTSALENSLIMETAYSPIIEIVVDTAPSENVSDDDMSVGSQPESLRIDEGLGVKEISSQTVCKRLQKVMDKISPTDCRFCQKNFTRSSNCNRHEKLCLLNPNPVENLKNIKTNDSSEVRQKHMKKAVCFIDGCRMQFYHRKKLVQHLKARHPEVEIRESINLKFKSLEDFHDWKRKEEEARSSFFVQKQGQFNKHMKYFYCQRDGSDKPHSIRKTSRKRARPSVKKNQCCIARMKVCKSEDGYINVEYLPTHTHILSKEDFQSQPASSSTLGFIDEQIAWVVTPSKVHHNLQEKIPKKTEDSDLPLELENDHNKEYYCKHCKRCYKNKVVLRVHEETVHSFNRPHVCTTCRQPFKTKGSLVRHTRTHTGERPFSCSQCKRAFLDSGTLARHVHRVHRKRPFKQASDVKVFITSLDLE